MSENWEVLGIYIILISSMYGIYNPCRGIYLSSRVMCFIMFHDVSCCNDSVASAFFHSIFYLQLSIQTFQSTLFLGSTTLFGQPFCCREPLIHVVKKSPATC